MQLSPQQRNAVEYTGSPTLVIAGAGSGKTRTLTAKIAYLVSKGLEPERILAITFTNKAAGEMKNRLVSMTGIGHERFPWVRTYHSACFRILKKYCHLLDYRQPLQIYSTYQQKKTLVDVALKMNFDKKYVPAIMSKISNAKNSGNPGDYFDRNANLYHIRLSDVYYRYEMELKDKNAVDFDNILLLTRNILRDYADVRQKYREYFQFVLVDEYQDSNNLQEELTRLLLEGNNLFCVGDDWQAIYGFRGSNVKHFLTFDKKYNNAKIFKLEENYRSSDEIVKLANKIISNNSSKMDKECFSSKQGGIVELNDFFSEGEEAEWVGRKIFSLRKDGIPMERIAVLYRTKFCSLAFEKAFRSLKIPYRMMGAKGFFDRREILDINSYLAASAFPKDDASFERVINTPKRGIGPAMLAKINGARSGDMSLQDAVRVVLKDRILTPKVHNGLNQLVCVLDEIKDMAPEEGIRKVLEDCGYLDFMKHYSKTDADFTARTENIDELIYTASQKNTILEFLEEASLVREDREDDEDGNSSQGGVRLSTVHASKGLEYKAVFIVACEEDLFPHWKSKSDTMELEEERRLMYVAITRAENHLFVTHSNFRRGEPAARSRFVDEIEDSIYGNF